jgi:4-hydroxyacetophenone monooxygenase
MFLTLEMQVRYAVDLISQMAERGFGEFECREAVESEYNERLDEAMEMMVWSHPKVETYAKNANGRCVAFIPYRNVDFYDRTKAAQLEDFDIRLNTVDAPLK